MTDYSIVENLSDSEIEELYYEVSEKIAVWYGEWYCIRDCSHCGGGFVTHYAYYIDGLNMQDFYGVSFSTACNPASNWLISGDACTDYFGRSCNTRCQRTN